MLPLDSGTVRIVVRHCTDLHGQPLMTIERMPLGDYSDVYPEMARAYARALLQNGD